MRRRRMISDTVRSEIWDRWKRGETLHDIGRVLDRSHTTIFAVLAPTGGIRSSDRKRSRRALTLAEREEISRGLVAGLSMRVIAKALGRAASTVSREIARNGGKRFYRAAKTDTRAWDTALYDPSPASLQAVPSCAELFLTNDNWIGHRIRSRVG